MCSCPKIVPIVSNRATLNTSLAGSISNQRSSSTAAEFIMHVKVCAVCISGNTSCAPLPRISLADKGHMTLSCVRMMQPRPLLPHCHEGAYSKAKSSQSIYSNIFKCWDSPMQNPDTCTTVWFSCATVFLVAQVCFNCATVRLADQRHIQ